MDNPDIKPANGHAFSELSQAVGPTEMQEQLLNSYNKCAIGAHTHMSSPYGALHQQSLSPYQQAAIPEATDSILSLDMYDLYTGNCYDYQRTLTSAEGSYWSPGCTSPVQYSQVGVHPKHTIPVNFQPNNFQQQASSPYSCAGSIAPYSTPFSSNQNSLYANYPIQPSMRTTSAAPPLLELTESASMSNYGRRLRTVKRIRSEPCSTRDTADSMRCLMSGLQSSPDHSPAMNSDLHHMTPNQLTPSRRSLTNESLNDSGFGSEVGTPPPFHKDQKTLQSCLITSTSSPLPYSLPVTPGNKPLAAQNPPAEDLKPVVAIKPSKKRPACDVPIDQPTGKKTRHNQPLNNNAVGIMQSWYDSHTHNPYPSKEEKKLLAAMGGISVPQVKSWFANKRNRSNNTRPKVEKKKMEQKLLNICKQLASDNKRPQETNTLIISQLSSLLQAQGNYL